jgi:hypothetical protein
MSFSVAAESPPDLKVSNPEWTYDIYRKFYVRNSANLTSSGRAPMSGDPVQEISAVFHNLGAKTIKSVTWEFIFYSDSANTKVERVYTSRNKVLLLPGNSVRLSKSGFIPGWMGKEARVISVEYQDGLAWKGTKTKK